MLFEPGPKGERGTAVCEDPSFKSTISFNLQVLLAKKVNCPRVRLTSSIPRAERNRLLEDTIQFAEQSLAKRVKGGGGWSEEGGVCGAKRLLGGGPSFQVGTP